MVEQKVLVITTGHKEECQDRVDAALEKLGTGWRIISVSSSLSTVMVGGLYENGRIYGNVVTTILVKKE